MVDRQKVMRFRLFSLASGSTGNSVFVECGSTRLLIDAGLSYKTLCILLDRLGVGPQDLTALLLTHEHSDHTQGLPVILKKTGLPVYTTEGTFEGLSAQKLFSRLPKENFRLFKAGDSFRIGDVDVRSLPISHDSLEPVAFRGDAAGVHFAVVTDLGCCSEELTASLRGLNALFLEANHNRQMLETGPYPYPLKLRIDGTGGHLSNEAAAELLLKICHPGLHQVILGHLSQTNNYPLLALETVRGILSTGPEAARQVRLSAAPPQGLSECIEFNTERLSEV